MSLQWEEGEEKDDQTGVSVWKTYPELLSQCFRGPASQIGYRRERDVTGELIWK